MKRDVNKEYHVTVVGEEPYVAYNRVGLSTFFEHRMVEDLYLNPIEWVCFPDTHNAFARVLLLTFFSVLVVRQGVL